MGNARSPLFGAPGQRSRPVILRFGGGDPGHGYGGRGWLDGGGGGGGCCEFFASYKLTQASDLVDHW